MPLIEHLSELKEDIRLLIWDLDDTFWDGTLSEGGIRWKTDHARLVDDLCRRGIVSSICSKNDFDTAAQVLKAHGIWDRFIFPSINWNPKGQRIAQLVQDIGLRPVSVLFLDDHPANLAEAAAALPGLNVALPALVPQLSDAPQLQGKPDPDGKRLAGYKVKERKAADRATSVVDHFDFLRRSGIKVFFDYDVDAHFERAFELINRTNQLNFTKARVDDPDALRAMLRHNTTDAALIRLQDRYGDYGYVGFYLTQRQNNTRRLTHFCFSCRTLHMYLEHFVYAHLGRPGLTVIGDTLTQPQTDQVDVDWISAKSAVQPESAAMEAAVYDRITARGGCDLASVMHYLTLQAKDTVEEFNGPRNDQMLRRDHSAFLMPALEGGLSDETADALTVLGYAPADFETALFDTTQGRHMALLSFWADADIPLYRHRATGVEVPYWLIGAQHHDLITRDDLRRDLPRNAAQRRRLMHLKEAFDHIGILSRHAMISRYTAILNHIDTDVEVVIILANEIGPAGWDRGQAHPLHRQLNSALRAVGRQRRNVRFVDPADVIRGRDDLIDLNHFRRDVYFRIAQQVMGAVPAAPLEAAG